MKTKTNEKGFTLVEVLITMVIISVGLLAMAQLLITTIQQNSLSERRIDSAAVVQALLNEAATKVTSDTTCDSLAANVATEARSYSNGAYTEQVTCQILGDESYLLWAQVKNPSGRVAAENQIVHSTYTGL